MVKQQALIIDDDTFNREIMATLLTDEGVEATAVSSPRNLPSLLATMPYLCVIFLDLEMPNHDGFAVHQQLRADQRFDGIPVVAYTVHTSEIDRVRRAGFDAFLGKPVQPEKFSQQLSRILSGKPVWEVG